MAAGANRVKQRAGVGQRTPARTRLRRAVGRAVWYYPILGALVAAGVVLVFPLASAVAALAVAAIGVGLSEGNVNQAARRVLLTGLGMILPPLAYLAVEIVKLR